MKKSTIPEAPLQPGTPCLIRSSYPAGAEHNGKLVIVQRFIKRHRGYDCKPALLDSSDGCMFVWLRKSLIPLGNSDAPDEMLRIAGKPKKARKAQPAGAH